MARARTFALVWLAPILLSACTTHQKHTTLDLDCKGLKLRFEERCTREFGVGTSCHDVLLLAKGNKWLDVDSATHRGPDAYSQLLPPALGYRQFPLDDARKRDPDRPRWGVFANPEVVSGAEYDIIAACLPAHIADIDGATFHPDRVLDHGPQVTSIVHAGFDPEFVLCGTKTIGRRWTCGAGEGYIKTRVHWGEPFILCAKDEGPSQVEHWGTMRVEHIGNGVAVGNVSSDRTAIFLKDPAASRDDEAYKKLLAGKDAWQAQQYYATCKDGAGKGFFETFRPISEAEKKAAELAP